MAGSTSDTDSLRQRARGQLSAGAMVVLIVAAVVGILFLPVMADTVNNSTGTQTITNETVTADYDTAVTLDGYQLVQDSETVYGYNDTSASWEVATSGTDYEMNYEPGEITVLNSSSLIDDGEELRVTYDYQATDSTTTLVLGFLPLLLGVLIFVTLAAGVMKQF